MEPAERTPSVKHKPKRTSRRSHKQHSASSSSTSSRASKTDERSSQAKPTPAGILAADAPSSSMGADSASAQPSPAPDITSAQKSNIPDADAAIASTAEVTPLLSSTADMTPAAKARIADTVASAPASSGVSMQLSVAPDTMTPSNPALPAPVVFTGGFQPTAHVRKGNSMIVEESAVVASPLHTELPFAREDINPPLDKTLEQWIQQPSVQNVGIVSGTARTAEKPAAPGEEKVTGRLIRSHLSDFMLPMTRSEEATRGGLQEPDVARTERMMRRSSTVHRLRDMGRSIRSSISSSVAMSPSSWGSSNPFTRHYITRGYEQRLTTLTAKERPKRAPRKREGICCKAVLGLTLQAVIGVLLVTALVAVFKMLIPGNPTPKVCRSHSCLEYSERLRRSINLSVSPCDSLERFVCSGWNSHHILSKRIILLETALARMSRLAHSVVHAVSDLQSPEQRGVALFRSCDDVLRARSLCSGKREELRNVRNALDEADVSWPVRPPTQRPPDTLRTLLFSALRLGWAAILRVDIRGGLPSSKDEPAPREPERHSVELTPSREFRMLARKYTSQLGLPDARRAYVGLLSEELGTAHANFSESAIDTAQRLDADFLVPLASTLVGERRRPSEAIEASMLFSGMPALANRWRNGLAEYGARAGYRLLMRAEHGNFFRTFLQLWESKGDAWTHQFVSWCTTQVAALFASRRLVVSFYDCDRHGPVIQGLHCLARAYLLSGISLFATYSADLFRGDTRAHAEALVRAVRETFRKTVMDEADNSTINANWNSTDVAFKAVDAVTDGMGDDGVEVRPSYPLLGDSLVDNWRHVAEAEPAALSTLEEVAVSSAIESLDLYAFVEHDFLLLPYAFSFPLYEEDAARAITYAGLGSQVAQALGALWVKEHRGTFYQWLNCVVPTFTKVHQAETQALQVLSTDVVFEAYRSTAEASDERLVGFESLTLPQLFFVAACYALCPGEPASARFIAGLTTNTSGAEPGCDAILRRTKHFAPAFGCTEKPTVNAVAECTGLSRG